MCSAILALLGLMAARALESTGKVTTCIILHVWVNLLADAGAVAGGVWEALQ
ncbi:MAG: hypothetical protein AB1505_13895 [Candidatus Latescibacterota bacterium]